MLSNYAQSATPIAPTYCLKLSPVLFFLLLVIVFLLTWIHCRLLREHLKIPGLSSLILLLASGCSYVSRSEYWNPLDLSKKAMLMIMMTRLRKRRERQLPVLCNDYEYLRLSVRSSVLLLFLGSTNDILGPSRWKVLVEEEKAATEISNVSGPGREMGATIRSLSLLSSSMSLIQLLWRWKNFFVTYTYMQLCCPRKECWLGSCLNECPSLWHYFC